MNYVMDTTHSALSHQIEVVESLSNHYDQVTVLTGVCNWTPTNPKIRVISTHWKKNRPLRNISFFYFQFARVYFSRRYNVVFSHMTVIQSSLVAPILRIFKTKHLVWYAHASNSAYLTWVHFWSNQILTSTPGSCPIKGEKVKYLGQMINEMNFQMETSQQFSRNSFIHVGRLDPSKNIETIIAAVASARTSNSNLTLTFVGDPSTDVSSKYLSMVMKTWEKDIRAGWLKFHSAIPRHEVSTLLSSYDIFIHAFDGSLDKSIVEATMKGIPVITSNIEYQKIFGVWAHNYHDLLSEIHSLLSKSDFEIASIVNSRRELAIAQHSLTHWTQRFIHAAS